MGVVAITTAIVALTLTTAYIHLSLGGFLFTLNGLGYAGLAAVLVVATGVAHPVVSRFDWLPRVALAGYTLTTIAGYLVMGPYFGLGWLTKAIEVVLVTLVTIDLLRLHGSPTELGRVIRTSLRSAPPPART
jgi:hypothetical protein